MPTPRKKNGVKLKKEGFAPRYTSCNCGVTFIYLFPSVYFREIVEEIYLSRKKDVTIKVSRELKEKLNMLGRKGDTYEDIIWRLVKAYERQEAFEREYKNTLKGPESIKTGGEKHET